MLSPVSPLDERISMRLRTQTRPTMLHETFLRYRLGNRVRNLASRPNARDSNPTLSDITPNEVIPGIDVFRMSQPKGAVGQMGCSSTVLVCNNLLTLPVQRYRTKNSLQEQRFLVQAVRKTYPALHELRLV